MPVLPEVGSTSVFAGADAAVALHRLDHGDADAVLDAGDRVEELELCEQPGGHAFRLGDLVEPHSGVSPIVSVIES